MLEAGRILGHRYEIVQEIGSGGMANVYKAKDSKLGRMVAIKVLKQEMALDESILSKFRKEALAAGSLNHPNIVSVYDLGHELGSDYIVMEFIDGITLKEYIRRRDMLSCEEVLKISIKIAEALKVAHQNGIVHRDIKPQNIMVTPKGDVKVTDFGIAKAATSNTVTSTGETLGSVHYLSPEQARGGEVDARSDLYSLGISMYEMATKELPFNAETPVAVAMKQVHDPFPNPLEKAPDMWDGLCDIIVKLTQKKPEFRYQDADTLIMDMKRLYRNHSYRIQSGVSVYRDHKAPDARLLAEQERIRLNAEKERIRLEREERLKEKKRKKTWRILILSMAGLLLVLLIVLLVAILRKGKSQEAEESGGPISQIEVSAESSDSADASDSLDSQSSEESKAKTVENYVGMAYDEAQAALRDYGYAVKIQGVNNEEAEIGEVVSQVPGEGESLGSDETVTLYVSLGPSQEFVTVPDLTRMTEEEAGETLEELELEIGVVTTTYSNSVSEGCVALQGTPEGTEVITGTQIDITVSLGSTESSDMTTQAGQITVDNPFEESTESGYMQVVALDSNGVQSVLYDDTISYSTFTALGGVAKINYPQGTVLVEVYLDGVLLQSEQITD